MRVRTDAEYRDALNTLRAALSAANEKVRVAEYAGMQRIECIVAGEYFYRKAKGDKSTPILSALLDRIAKERASTSTEPKDEQP